MLEREPVAPEPAPAPAPASGGPGWIVTLVVTLLGAAGTGLLMAWRLSRPALWGDETATTVAVDRPWEGFWDLFHGSEAPLMPYYAVLKVLRGWTLDLVPSAAAHIEVLQRWPSAVAVALGGALLAGWLTRAGSVRFALVTLALLLLTSGVSRYGQEARPYAFVLALAIVSTVLWWQLTHRRGLGWPLLYAIAAGAMIAFHLLSIGLLAGHAVALLVLRRDRPGQPGALPLVARSWRFALGAGLAAGLAFPVARLAAANGVGGKTSRTLDLLLPMFQRMFVNGAHPALAEVVLMWTGLVALPIIGVAGQWFSPRYANLTRLALCWAVVPPAALLPVVDSRPNLITTRYILFTAPGWAMLAALGLLTVANLLSALAGRRRWLSAALQGVVLVGALAAATVVQTGSLLAVRSGHGHSEDFRLMLAVLDRPAYQRFPVEIFPPDRATGFDAYAPDQAVRLINSTQTRDGSLIWNRQEPKALVDARLSVADGVIILMRGDRGPKVPKVWDGCTILEQGRPDPKWSFMVLARTFGADETCALPTGPPSPDR